MNRAIRSWLLAASITLAALVVGLLPTSRPIPVPEARITPIRVITIPVPALRVTPIPTREIPSPEVKVRGET